MNSEQLYVFDIERRGSFRSLKRTSFSDAATGLRIIPFTGSKTQFDCVKRWELDDDVSKYLYIEGRPETSREIHEYYVDALRSREDADFCIQEKSGRLVGVVSLNDISLRRKTANFGIFIGEKSVWGKGVGSTAAELLFSRLKQFGFTTVRSTVHYDNEASIRVLRRFPCKVEKYHGYDEWLFMTIFLDKWDSPDTPQLVVEEVPKN